MTKTLITICLLLASSVSWAQNTYNKRVVCTDTEKLIKALTGKEYQEKPIWMGVNKDDHTFSVFVNNDTKGWTIIEFKGRTACVLGAGEESLISTELNNN